MTTREKVVVDVAPLASVTVTVKVVAEIVPLGDPVMAPVDGFNVKPAGSTGDTLKPNGAVPPLPVTGVTFTACP